MRFLCKPFGGASSQVDELSGCSGGDGARRGGCRGPGTWVLDPAPAADYASDAPVITELS